MKFTFNLFLSFLIIALQSISVCIAQNDITLSATPESYPGAMDGKIVATVDIANFPPPYLFRINELEGDALEFQNYTGTFTFTGLGYRYYCITVIMGNNCHAYGCFQFDEPCSSEGCLIADFNVEYTTDGCTVQFLDWSQVDATSWEWDFGDGTKSTAQDPIHTYSESRCYNVTLQATSGSLTRELSREVCITACADENVPAPECQINAVTYAAADQTINLSVSGVGVGPFQYEWNVPNDIYPVPDIDEQTISAHIPNDADNGDTYNFLAQIWDNNGNSTSCAHTMIIGGNLVDVEVLIFGTCQQNAVLVLGADVDFTNLTGPEDYFFTITQGNTTIQGECLNQWQPTNQCALPNGLLQGIYEVCVKVRDAAGTYEHCKPLNIGNATPPPPSPDMYLEIKPPSNPEISPGTGHYILESGSPIHIGVNGTHPHGPHPLPCTQDEYYIILYCKNLATGETFNIGDPVGIDPALMSSMPNGVPGKGKDWYYEMGQGCKTGTLSITADVYNIRCDDFSYPPDLDNDPSILYSITEPLYLDLYPKKPTISEISINNNACNFPINVTLSSSCGIASYEWHAYDPNSNEEIIGFFTSNTNAATVYPDLSHDMYFKYQSGAVVRFRCKVIVVDVNGFTAEYSSFMMMRVPLRIDLPSTIYRCPGVASHFLETSIAAGGISHYEYEWSVVQPVGGSLDFASNDQHDPNPLFTAPSSGSKQYKVSVNNLNEYGEVICHVEKTITVMVSSINLDLPDITWPICSTGGREVGPIEPENLGGSGHYTFVWNPDTYLSDANDSNPLISGIPVGPAITYTLTATDIYGGCTSSDNIVVTSVPNTHTASFPDPVNICYGAEALLQPQVSPIETAPPFGNAFNKYQWSTNNPHHDLSGVGSLWELPIDEIVSSYPSPVTEPYVYTLRYQNIITGCYAEASVDVTIHPPFRYTGYVPSIRTTTLDTQVPVWQASSDNEFTDGVVETGSNCNASVSWSPPHVPTDITYSNSGSIHCLIPRNGMFTPTISNPFTVLKVRNTSTGCVEEYKSIRYILIDEQAELTIVPSNRVICIGDPVCFEVIFDAHVSNYQTALLPSKITLQYKFHPPSGSGQEASLTNTIDLDLTNSFGLYKGAICNTAYFNFPTAIDNINESAHYRLEANILNSDALKFGFNPPYQYDCECSVNVLIDARNSEARPNLESCFIPSNIIVYHHSVDIGNPNDDPIGCDNNHRVITGDIEIIAGSYIEIHPEGEISLEYLPQMEKGPLLLINPCIEYQPEGPEPKPEDLPNGLENIERYQQIESKLNSTGITLEVSPNPFTGEVSIQYSLPPDCTEEALINLLDITGKHLRTIEKRKSTLGGQFEIIFDGQYLPPGVYFYEMAAGNCRKIKKAVKIGF